jgi:hypothetical protein
VNDDQLCRNCNQPILWSPGSPVVGHGYWYHPATSTIWCSGWGDPDDDGRQATGPRPASKNAPFPTKTIWR